MTKIYFMLLCCLMLTIIYGQPEGWRMIDRFYGFRYELTFSTYVDSILELIQSEATDQACFGWVQQASPLTVVGEIRCSKTRGPLLQEKLSTIHSKITKTDILVYEDTKIRLHFSSFKILPSTRETCFYDSPHQCKDIKQRQSTPSSSQETSNTNYKAGEL